MSKDLEKIALIEKEIGRKLTRYNKSSFFGDDANETYLLDKHENVIGLILCDSGLSDISFLKLLPNLTQLDLSNNNITDISVLKFLPNLIQLYLVGYNDTDISVLNHLSNLTMLDLSVNNITNISVLKYLPNLTHIYLHSNNINNISILKSLTNIKHIDLSSNKIKDISVLKFLPNLTYLDLSNNYIRDISVLEKLKKLSSVELNYNNISELPKGLLSLNLKIEYEEFVLPDNVITVYDNPIKTPPLEIVKKGNAAIKSYFKSLGKHGKQTLCDVGLNKTAEVIERADEIKYDSEAANISYEELIKRIKQSDNIVRTAQVTTTVYLRNEYVSEFAKRKAKGICQLCENFAPFNDSKGKPYLESHHITWLSREGDDSVENVIALCPNCHTKMHILDVQSDVEKLKRKAMENSKYML